MKTEVRIEEFRVPPEENVNLKEWSTLVKPFYKSKKRYHKLLKEYVDELSSLQRMHYASNRFALLLIFQGMDSAGKDGARAVALEHSTQPLLTAQFIQRHDLVLNLHLLGFW